MRIKTLNIVAIMLIVFVVAIAGCSSKSPSSANSTPASGSSSPSSSQQVGSTVSSSSVFGTNYNWMQFQITNNYGGTEMNTTTKIEKSTGDYKGTPAIHQKMTSTTSNNGNVVYDIYYDTSKNNVLGGTMTMTINGQTMTQDIPASQLSTQAPSSQITNFNQESSLTYAGTESVTVPAGTFQDTSKYTVSSNGNDITYWVASGVPVPVKMTMTSSSAKGSTTFELMGWG
jgi:hypothetical protein